MKQKYLLLGAGIILLILVIISFLFKSIAKKPQIQTLSQSQLPNKTYSSSSNTIQNSVPPEKSPFQNSLKQQKEYIATRDFLNLFSAPAQQGVFPSPATPSTQQNIQNTESNPRKILGEFLEIVFGQNTGSLQQSSFYPGNASGSSKLNSTELNFQNEKPSNLIYYSQCNGEYDTYPLPGGCTVCKAGCGQTSVAMILSSYIDKKFTPSAVVDLYKQNGLEAGCKGSTIGDAQQILEQNGMKTTDLLYYGETLTEEVINDLKSYMQYGWTMFMLAKFCPKGCGHFFWIVDVDQNNNIWTYDPGYGNIDGKKIVPLNETLLNPSAQYYAAFGVRKQ